MTELSSERFKVVVVGDLGVGKTTALRALSEGRLMDMEVPMTEDSIDPDKQTTTVGFDFAVLMLSETPVYLYGAPGQQRFGFVAGELLAGALGVILLVDLCAADPIGAARHWLERIAEAAPGARVVVGLSREHLDAPSLNAFRRVLGEAGVRVLAVQCVDPRSRLDLLNCLRLLTLACADARAQADGVPS